MGRARHVLHCWSESNKALVVVVMVIYIYIERRVFIYMRRGVVECRQAKGGRMLGLKE